MTDFTVAGSRQAVHVQGMSLSEILPKVRNLSVADFEGNASEALLRQLQNGSQG